MHTGSLRSIFSSTRIRVRGDTLCGRRTAATSTDDSPKDVTHPSRNRIHHSLYRIDGDRMGLRLSEGHLYGTSSILYGRKGRISRRERVLVRPMESMRMEYEPPLYRVNSR